MASAGLSHGRRTMSAACIVQQELQPPQPQLAWRRQREGLALLRERDAASEIAARALRGGGAAALIVVPRNG